MDIQPPAQPDVLGPDHVGNPEYDPNANPTPLYVFGNTGDLKTFLGDDDHVVQTPADHDPNA